MEDCIRDKFKLDIEDTSLLRELSLMSIDNRTIHSPPLPVAASTVVRGTVNRCQIQTQVQPHPPIKPRSDFFDPKGSFLDNEQWPVPPVVQSDEHMSNRVPVAKMSFSDHCPPVSADDGCGKQRVTSTAEDLINRSSLGILPLEVMDDNSLFEVPDVPRSELLNFGHSNGNTKQPLNQTPSLKNTSKDLRGADSSNDQPVTSVHTIGTVKKHPALVQPHPLSGMHMVFSGGEGPDGDGDEPEASICEVQFEDRELADLDDDFGDFGEIQYDNEDVEKEANDIYRAVEHFPAASEDWFQFYREKQEADNYSPVSIAFGEGEECIQDEAGSAGGHVPQTESEDTEDELEAVRRAMRGSLSNDRQNGVGSCEETSEPDLRPGLEGGSDHFADSFTRPSQLMRQSAEGEVVFSPVPGYGGGGGDGSSIPSGEDHFMTDDSDVFETPTDPRNFNMPQVERRIRPVGDETRDSLAASSVVNHPVVDSVLFRQQDLTGLDESQRSQFGLGEESSYHFDDYLQAPQTHNSNEYQGQRLEASGLCQEDEFDSNFMFNGNNSLGSFGASPERDDPQCLLMENKSYGVAEVYEDPQQMFDTMQPENSQLNNLKKTFISSQSPVYIDENGVGVTDLAFQTSLANEAAFQKQMFEEWGKDGPCEDPLAASYFQDQEDFIDGDNALVMLQKAEKEFMEENIVAREDQMDQPGNFDDSWIFQTSVYLANSTRKMDQLRQGDAYMRISIGEFMRSRSDALGSLDGDPFTERPHFGNKITTPPSDRSPVTLLKQTLHEGGPAMQMAENVRQDGVGFETEGNRSPSPNDKPLTMDDIDPGQNTPEDSSGYVSKGNTEHETDKPPKELPSLPAKDPPHYVDDLGLSTASRVSEVGEVSLSDKTGALSLSAITNIISSASPNCKAEDIANMLLTQCFSKAEEKKGKDSKVPISKGDSEPLSVDNKEKPRYKPAESRLPVRKTTSNSQKTENTTSNPVLRRGKSLEQKKPRKGSSSSPCNRGQPLGSTESSFKQNQTVKPSARSNLPNSKNKAKEVNEKRGDGHQIPQGCQDGLSKPRPDGQEADQVHTAPKIVSQTVVNPTPPIDPSPLTGSGNYHPEKKQEIPTQSMKGDNTSSPAPSTSPIKPSTDNQERQTKFHSPRLSEIARNMTVDFSKVELCPDFTLTDYITEGNERSFSPADGRDTDNGKPGTQASKVNSKDTFKFKKPEVLPVKKGALANTNRSAVVNKQAKSKPVGNNNNTRQFVSNKSKAQDKDNANKENQFSSNKTGVPDKVMENKNIENQSLLQGHNRFKESLKATQNNLSPQNQLLKDKRSDMDLTTKGVDLGGRPTDKSSPVPCSSIVSHRPMQTVQSVPSSHSNQVNCQPGPVLHLTQMLQLPTQINQNPAHSQHSLQRQYPMHIKHTSQHQDPPASGPHSLPAPNKPTALELCTPRNLSSHPALGLNLHTPMPTTPIYNSLEEQSMMSFDHGLPAYQSTPFYHALAPYDASDMTGIQREIRMVMKTPSLAKDFCNTPSVISKMIEVSSVLNFEEICCVGVSTKASLLVQNKSDHWLDCVLEVQQLTINGQCVEPSLKLPFMFNQKTIVEPNCSESISVIFVPNCEGIYIARMAVFACPVVQNKELSGQICQPEYVTLKASAEMPNIEVLSENYLSLVFGELKWGSCKGLPLNLVNRGKATVPLRLSISSNTSCWHCFAFEQSTTSDLSIISGSSRPPTPALSKSVINLTLNSVSDQNASPSVSLMVYCKLREREATAALRKSPPEVIQAKVEIEVDTPSNKLLVGTASLHAIAGNVKLLTSLGYEPLELVSYGERAVAAYQVQNGGNIAMNLSVRPRDYEQGLKVVPSSLTVNPGEFQEITVMYSPTLHLQCLETVLLMAVEPDGPVFETTVIARCLTKLTPPVQPEVQILCNKSYLSFGGVEIGKSGSQHLTLVHHAVEAIKIKLEVTPEVFQIKTLFGHKETLTNVKEVFVKPGEEYTVHLSFLPTALSQFQGKLIIRQDGCRRKFAVPLNGHGGKSCLVLEDSTDSSKGGNYYRNIGGIKVGQNNVQRVSVWNIGSRAAFVKVFCFSDVSCSQLLSDNVAVVQPNEFVLKADSAKTLVLMLNPTHIQAVRCQEKRSVVGVLKFYFGDEISRRLYRRSLATQPGGKNLFPKTHPLARVNLAAQLQDESDVEEDADWLVSSPNDHVTFSKGISRVVLSLVGEAHVEENSQEIQGVERIVESPKPGHTQSGGIRLAGMSPVISQESPTLKSGSLPSDRVCDGVRKGSPILRHDLDVSVVPSKHGVRVGSPSSSNNQSRQNHGETTQPKAGMNKPEVSSKLHTINSLEVLPEQLILDLKPDGKCIKNGCVQVRNMTEAPTSFDVSWPDRRLTVQFDTGVLQPRATCCLYVSPSPLLSKEGISLPWSGRVRVDTQLESQTVSVLVRKCMEEQKVSNIDNKHDVTYEEKGKGHAHKTTTNQPSTQKAALNISKEKPERKGGALMSTLSRKSSFSKTGKQDSPPVRAASMPSQSVSVSNSAATVARHSDNSAFTSQQVKSKLTSASKQPHGTVSQNIARHSPSEASKLKNSGQKVTSAANQQLLFSASQLGDSAKTTLSLSNSTDQLVTWTLSSFTPPYLKVHETGEGPGTIQRIEYDVFKFSQTSGQLQPRETIQIAVLFEPQQTGYFSQFWEVTKTTESNSYQTNDKVQLLAEALPTKSVSSVKDQHPQSTDAATSSINSDRPKQAQKTRSFQNGCVISLLTDTLEFAAWGPRQTEECKAQVKNRDNVVHRVEIVPPKEPFHLKYTSVKIRGGHFVKLPIEFKPRQIGTYEGVVIFRPDVGQSLSLKLKGTCR